MSLWIPLYESIRTQQKAAIATFSRSSLMGFLWSNDNDEGGYDAVLFGQVEPTRVDVDKLQARLRPRRPCAVKQSLAEVGFQTADWLACHLRRPGDGFCRVDARTRRSIPTTPPAPIPGGNVFNTYLDRPSGRNQAIL